MRIRDPHSGMFLRPYWWGGDIPLFAALYAAPAARCTRFSEIEPKFYLCDILHAPCGLLTRPARFSLAICRKTCYAVDGISSEVLGAAQRQAVVSYTTRKGVKHMPITITFHVFTYTITITVKQNRRHSAK